MTTSTSFLRGVPVPGRGASSEDTNLVGGCPGADAPASGSAPDLTSPPQPCSVEVRGGLRSSSPAPSGRGRIIRDPFAGYLEEAFAVFIPHAGFGRARRAIDGAASGPARAQDELASRRRTDPVQPPPRPREDGPEEIGPASRGLTGAVPSTALAEQPDESHGTTTGYTYWRRRCDLCREAMSIYRLERRLRLAEAR